MLAILSIWYGWNSLLSSFQADLELFVNMVDYTLTLKVLSSYVFKKTFDFTTAHALTVALWTR